MLEWLMENWQTIAAVVAAVAAGCKAYRNGTLNAFLVAKIEGIAEPADKQAIKNSALAAGLQGLLHKVVKKNT